MLCRPKLITGLPIHVLDRIEREASAHPEFAGVYATVGGAQRQGAVLDQDRASLRRDRADRVHIARQAQVMHHLDGPEPIGHGIERRHVDVAAVGRDIDEHRRRAEQLDHMRQASRVARPKPNFTYCMRVWPIACVPPKCVR